MPKLAKNYYYSSTGEKKVNCYNVNIPKDIVRQTNIQENDEIKVYAKDKKIIIERKD